MIIGITYDNKIIKMTNFKRLWKYKKIIKIKLISKLRKNNE